MSSVPPQVEYKASPIHGVGVFAKEFIPKGTKIGRFEGQRMRSDVFYAIYSNDTRYCYIGKKYCYVSKTERCWVTWLNEAKDYNVYLRSLNAFARIDIEPGTELTLRYGNNYPRDYVLH